jgi:hypothetical protein
LDGLGDGFRIILKRSSVAAVALFHLVRIFMAWTVDIGDWSVPMWFSWIGLIVAGGLAFFGFRLAAHEARYNEWSC